MAEVTYRANLSSAGFPLVSEFHGQTVIVPGPDQAYTQSTSSRDAVDRAVNVPQLYYGHNFLPVSNGFHTVDYVQKVAALSGTPDINQIYAVYNSDGKRGYVAWGRTSATTRSFNTDTNTWVTITDGIGIPSGSTEYDRVFTSGVINGLSYFFCYAKTSPASNSRAFTINLSTGALASVTLTGLSIGDVRGLASVAGYLIAWTDTAIAWSSVTTPTDFVPSDTTGAGGGNVQEARGKILAVLSSGFGAILYTEVNAIAITYTGNQRYPFSFKEIKGSAGAVTQQLIAFDANSQSQIAYTTSGLQSLSATKSDSILPELTDFLRSNYFEDFDESTDTFTRDATGTFLIKLVLIADRYIVVSYGKSPSAPAYNAYTHALVYDLLLDRYGKLKIPHMDCFEYQEYDPNAPELALNSIGFISSEGLVKIARVYYGAQGSGGVLILGKYQYVRARFMQLDEVHIENVNASQTITVKDMYSVDGKNTYATVTGYLDTSTGTQRNYLFESVGMNHSILIKGSVNLTSFLLRFHIHGKG